MLSGDALLVAGGAGEVLPVSPICPLPLRRKHKAHKKVSEDKVAAGTTTQEDILNKIYVMSEH